MEPAERRRRVPRIQTDNWLGKCMIERSASSGPVVCEVVDISLLGAGIEIISESHIESPSDVEGRRIDVEVRPPLGSSISLFLTGIVGNVTELQTGGIRIGLEFSELSETEKAIVRVFEEMEVFW